MKIFKNIILLFSATFLLQSCSDYLEQTPDDRAKIDNLSSVGQLLVNAYPKATYTAFCEVMSDNVGDRGIDAYISTTGNTDAFMYAENFSSKYQGSPDYYWAETYKAIAHANQALDILKTMDVEGKDSYVGEALVARAYAHFMLVNLFAVQYNSTTAATDLGVPYVKEVEKNLLKFYKRNTVQEVYDFIEVDLLKGIELLDDSRYEVIKYHFNKNAANAFAARFYLWRGASDQDYENSIMYADKVLGANPSSILRDWNGYYNVSTYADIKLQYTKASEKPNLLITEATDSWGYYGPYQRYSFVNDNYQKILFRNHIKEGIRYSIGVYGNDKSLNIPKFTQYKIKDNPSSTSYIGSFMCPILTTDELITNRIEANTRIKDFDAAVADINILYKTMVAGYDRAIHTVTLADIEAYYSELDTYHALIECTIHLRRVLFIHEGLRWFDIKRFDIPVVHTKTDGTTYTLEAKDAKKVLQIPENAVANHITPNIR